MQTLREGGRTTSFGRYSTALRAIIESALVTWIGILICEAGILGPSKGHVVVRPIHFNSGCAAEGRLQLNQNFGDIMLSIIPVFFVSDYSF